MKLHLNATLRAALIAAISTVGFTLSQAQAADYTIITFAPEGNTSSWADYNIYHSGYPASPAGGATTIITDAAMGDSGITYSVRLENGGGKVGTDTPINVSSWTNSAALAEMNTAMGTSLTTTELAQSYYLYGWQGGRIISQTFNFTGATAETDKVKNGDTITLYVGVTAHDTNLSSFTLTGLSDDTTYTYATDTGSGFGAQAFSSGAKHLTIVKVEGTVEDASAMKFSGSGKNGISFIAYDAVAPAPVATLTWNGTEDNHVLTATVWNDGTETPAAYSDASPLVFGTDGYRTVSVVADTTAKSVEVQASGYTIENAANTTLSVKSITVAEGATLALGGTGTTALSGSLSIADAGSLKVAEGATLKVTGANAAKAVLTDTGLDNKGTVEVGADITIDGSLTSKLGGTLAVASGKKLTLGTTKDSHTIDLTSLDALVLGQGANIDTKAFKATINNLTANGTTLKMLDTKDKNQVGVDLKGTTTLAGNLTITGDWKYKINIEKLAGTGSLQLTGGNEEHRAVIGDASIHSLNVTNKMNEVWLNGTVTLGGTLNVNGTTHVTGANALTVGGLTGSAAMDVANGITFNVAEGEDYSYTGTLTVGGQVVKKGEGTQTLSGYVMHHVIDLEAGTLSLAGTYDISSLSPSSEPRYMGGDGIGEGSGFKESSGVVQVVNITDGATLTQVEGVTFTYGADTGTLNEQGAFELSGAVDYTTLYVNNANPVSYTSAWDLAQSQGEEISSVVLANATSIDADMEDASIALSLTGATGTVNATAATTISGVSGWSGRALTITGGAAVSLVPGQTIVIGEGSTLTVDATVNAQKVQLNGTGASLIVTAGGTLTTSNNLTLTNGKADIHGTVNVGHEVDLSDGNKATGTLHIHGGGDVTVKDGMWMSPNAAGVLLDEDATFAITGKGVLFAGKEGGNGSIKASGAEVNYTANNANAVITNVTMTATADITIGNTLNNVDVVTGEHGVTLNAAADSVTVGTDGSISFGTAGSTAAITVEDGGAIGSYTKTNEGETTITSVGTAILANIINLQTGKITMTGKYDIDSLYGDVEITGYDGGAVDGNGFAHETGTVQVVAITDGAELDSDSATFLRGGSELTLTDGSVEVDGTNYAGFYINSGEETLTQAKSAEIPHETPLSFIYVKDGGTLQVDDDMDGELVYGQGAGTVNIQDGKTVTGAMEGVTLAGAGTYDLGSTASLGTGTTLGQDWTGVVSLSNLTKADGSSAWIGGLANENSWIEFTNFTGYDRAWASTFVPAVTANIILTDDGEHAAWNLTAFASSTYTMVISGDVKGHGTFKTSGGTAAQSQAVEFRGNISAWDGAFVADAPGMRRVAFTGENMTVNASIAREGAGALNLVVGNGSDQTNAWFNDVVNVTSVEVKANAIAMFEGGLTTSTVTNAGTVVFYELGGLTQTITNSGDITFNAGFEVSGFQVTAGEFGYYDTEGNFSVDGNGYAGTSDSYITIVNGGSVNADEITVTQDGTGYTMSSDGRALADDGGVTDEYTFHVNTGTVSTSEIDGGTATSVEVAGGTLNVDQTTGLDITVTGNATVTGEALDVSAIGIDGGATAYFGDKLEMSDGGVEFQSAEGGSVGVYNDGDTAAYDLYNRDMEVSAHSIVKTTGEDATVSNWLYVDKIVNVQNATLTLDGLDDAVSVKNITVGQKGIVEILDHESGQEATVTVSEELAAGNGTLLANLVMANDSALLVGGAQKALHVGSTLTMGQNIALDTTTLQALDGLAVGDYFWLIDAAEDRELVYEGPTGDNAWYDSVFSRVAANGDYELKGDFNIVFDDELDAFGLKKFSNVPEPTTGTLSLLALAALAARRRKHN